MFAATMPPAPGTFSTTNGLPNAVASLSANSRAITSGLPTGPDAAISRTARFGHVSSWADAGEAPATASTTPKTASKWLIMFKPRPDFARKLDYQPELVFLHGRRDRVAGVDAGKAA